MGEEYVCPHCDHIDSGAGECPECGGSMIKLDDEVENFSNEELEDGALDLDPSSIGDFDDFDDPDSNEHYRAVI